MTEDRFRLLCDVINKRFDKLERDLLTEINKVRHELEQHKQDHKKEN